MAHGACGPCGCAFEECECSVSEVQESATETLRRVNRLLASLKKAEPVQPKPRTTLKVGMWVRITKGVLWSGEGRVESIERSRVTLAQLNGTKLVVPRDIVEEAALGTTWNGLVDALGSRI